MFLKSLGFSSKCIDIKLLCQTVIKGHSCKKTSGALDYGLCELLRLVLIFDLVVLYTSLPITHPDT